MLARLRPPGCSARLAPDAPPPWSRAEVLPAYHYYYQQQRQEAGLAAAAREYYNKPRRPRASTGGVQAGRQLGAAAGTTCNFFLGYSLSEGKGRPASPPLQTHTRVSPPSSPLTHKLLYLRNKGITSLYT